MSSVFFKRLLQATLVSVAVLGGIGLFVAHSVGQKAAGIAVRWACPCVFSEGRTLEYCMENLPIDVSSIVTVSDDKEAATLHARGLYIAARQAKHIPRRGCVMDK